MQPPPRNAKRKLWPVAESRWRCVSTRGEEKFRNQDLWHAGVRVTGPLSTPLLSEFEPQQTELEFSVLHSLVDFRYPLVLACHSISRCPMPQAAPRIL